jgi:hypothetical protein
MDKEPTWVKNFITVRLGKFVAWDEIGADELGVFYTREEAVNALLKYAETIDVPGDMK